MSGRGMRPGAIQSPCICVALAKRASSSLATLEERSMHDIVIRGGTVIDGTGKAAFTGDVAIAGERIAEVGGKLGPARREIDATGLLVTPGWVDVHTHYDGQAIWDPLLGPSCWHGVTTAMFGNCGVGFAPDRASPIARLRHGRARHSPRGGASRRYRPDAPSYGRSAARRHFRFHHFAYGFAQDARRQDGPLAICSERRARRHRRGAGRRGRRR